VRWVERERVKVGTMKKVDGWALQSQGGQWGGGLGPVIAYLFLLDPRPCSFLPSVTFGNRQ
jgi:hypothetical protein